MGRVEDAKFWELLHQISSEHERIVSHLHRENEDLKTRLGSHMPLDADGDASESAPGSVDQGRVGSVSEKALKNKAVFSQSPSFSEPQPEALKFMERIPKRKRKRRCTSALVAAVNHADERIGQPDGQEHNQESQLHNHRSLRQKVHWLVNHEAFELVVVGIIMLNTLGMAMELQYKGMEAGYQLGYRDMSKPANEVWPHVGDAFPNMEKAFTVVFIVELALRMYGNGVRYLVNQYNWVDLLVVVVGVVDWSLELASPNTYVNNSVVQLLRLVRVFKGFRIVAKFVRVLDLLVSSIAASFSTLAYSLGLLGVVQIVASFFMVQVLSDYINDTTKPDIERQLIYSYWGTFTYASLTMFEITFANWSPPCRALVTLVHESYAIFFYVYRCFVGFAAISVVGAVFIQKTLQQAQSKDDAIVAEQQRQTEQQRQKLVALFTHLDTSGDGTLSWDEFQHLLGQPKLLLWLKAFEVEVSDLETLFKVLDEGTGDIEINRFVASMQRIRGNAKSLDMMQLLSFSNETRKLLEVLASRLSDQGQLLRFPFLKAHVCLNDTHKEGAPLESSSHGTRASRLAL